MASPYRPLPAGIRRFRIDPASFRPIAAWFLVRRWLLLATLALSVLGIAARLNPTNLAGYGMTLGFIAALLVSFMVYRLLTLGTALGPALARFELLLSDRVLRRTAATGPVCEVLRDEVSTIVETPKGLWVSCERPARAFFVSRALDGYADVREALAAWASIKPVRGLSTFLWSRRGAWRQGPRDSIAGTALASDPSLVAELELVRASSIDAGATPPGMVFVGANAKSKATAIWVMVMVLFLGAWQVLQPHEQRRPLTDTSCQARGACASFGMCRARGDRCVAGGDDDCKQSQACTKLGRCIEVGGVCFSKSDGMQGAPQE